MFARIMAVVLANILLTTVCLSAVWWLTLRNQRIDARLDYLNSQAEEIAYLAGNLSGDNLMDTIRDRDSVTRVYLNRMSARVSEEFEAFIMLMDENGNMMIYDQARKADDTEFRESLNSEEIAGAFQRILAGETIRMRSEGGKDPTFTVGVPYTVGNRAAGAVFIRTRAQKIESGLGEIL